MLILHEYMHVSHTTLNMQLTCTAKRPLVQKEKNSALKSLKGVIAERQKTLKFLSVAFVYDV